MDKQFLGWAVNAGSIFFAAVISLLIYIWKDSKGKINKDHDRTERDVEKLFKAVTHNTENIKSMITEFKGFREICDVKRQNCLGKKEGGANGSKACL